MARFGPIWFSISTIVAAWLTMTAIHELGHIMHARISGARVVEVELPPHGLGHTLVHPNPRPQFVAWGGACWGCSLPLAIWLCARRWSKRRLRLATFFAGLCLIANGAYLAAGTFIGDPNGADDAHELLRHGATQWQILGFGVVASAAGLWLWHGLAPVLGAPWWSPSPGWREGVAMAAVVILPLGLGIGLGDMKLRGLTNDVELRDRPVGND